VLEPGQRGGLVDGFADAGGERGCALAADWDARHYQGIDVGVGWSQGAGPVDGCGAPPGALGGVDLQPCLAKDPDQVVVGCGESVRVLG